MEKENWLKILLSYASPCRGKMVASVLCAIVSVGGGFVPYLGVYKIISMFINDMADWSGVLFWSSICLAGYIVKIFFYCISTTLSHISAFTILEGLRLKIADRLMHAPLGTVQSKSIGSIKSTMVDRVESIEPPLAHLIPELTSNLLLPIVVIIALFSIDWRMGLASLVTLPAAAIPITRIMKTYNSQYEAYMEANDHVNSIIVEYIEGIEVVKAFNQTTDSYKKYSDAVKSFKDFTIAWFKSTWKSVNLTYAILPSTLLGTLPTGVALYLNGVLAPDEFALCLMLAMGIVPPLLNAAKFIDEAKSMEFAVRDANELLHLPQLHEEDEKINIRGTDVALRDVSFSYSGDEQDSVLHNVNISMPAGSFTALVGPSGGGKSTVARLIARFWDVTEGKIEIGGTDIRQMPLSQLSDIISFVTQDNFLFNCSLKENIRLGNPSASNEEVFKAADMAQCCEFINKLEKGWETSAGEAGKKLSGGERQRIAIARTILKNAPIVILDEATAFTDPENEDKIQKSIAALSKGKTLMVIAHRLSTIKNADQIVVLDKGRIVDTGQHIELLERCSLYEKLWENHIGAKNWGANATKEEKAYV
jgi:ATP-binding cassette subfamily B protein IrtA